MTTNTKSHLRTISNLSSIHLATSITEVGRLPRRIQVSAESRKDDGEVYSRIQGGPETVKPARSRKSILCIESDAEERKAIATVLASYELTWSDMVEDARELYRLQRFSLIFIADKLPDGDGLELCEQIRGEDYLTPIIIMTRNPELSEIDTRIAGAQRLIKKHHPDYLKELRALADNLSV
ncbi:MAG: hypothetical protein DMF63_02550 [Acidobacteria bacterium]|nr:MAG: hypothetical protein DMF63_02550 [Acidobacteriota bacterium]